MKEDILEPPRIDYKYHVSETDAYVRRHIGNDAKETQAMLEELNCNSMDQLMNETVPDTIRLKPNEAFRHNGKTL